VSDPVLDMTAGTDEQAKFAAREFVAQLERECGGSLGAVVTDRVLFAFEIGYLRGWRDGARVTMAMYDETRKADDP
jgi:hypothetical protein